MGWIGGPIGYQILPVTPILPAIQAGTRISSPFSTIRTIRTERGWLNGVDSGSRVDLGVHSAPNQPRNPNQPRYHVSRAAGR
jgi:hypothetical protein